jgi:hypothetical protein
MGKKSARARKGNTGAPAPHKEQGAAEHWLFRKSRGCLKIESALTHGARANVTGTWRAFRRSSGMDKKRIIVTCPRTGVVVITKIAYDDMITPAKSPKYFNCPCGETHKLVFAGWHSGRGEPKRTENHRAG